MDSRLDRTVYQPLNQVDDEVEKAEVLSKPSRRWKYVLLFGYIVLTLWTLAITWSQLDNLRNRQEVYCKSVEC